MGARFDSLRESGGRFFSQSILSVSHVKPKQTLITFNTSGGVDPRMVPGGGGLHPPAHPHPHLTYRFFYDLFETKLLVLTGSPVTTGILLSGILYRIHCVISTSIRSQFSGTSICHGCVSLTKIMMK